MLRLLALAPLLALAACATAAPPSGFLSGYDGLQAEGSGRAAVSRARDDGALGAVKSVLLEPTLFAPGAAPGWINEAEQGALLREIDAQLCFELSERYAVQTTAGSPADARVRAAVVGVTPTGRFGSLLSAAAGFAIPGPLGVRAPGTEGSLSMEAEMLAPDGRQLAAVTWSRRATAIGTDAPSLSRIGDALQFAEPFADEAARTMTASGVRAGRPAQPDPCAAFGPRNRPAGFLARIATGLYIPPPSAPAPEGADPAQAERP